mmetsp:Transcript_17521/g.49779  ORF Transcript_17521/g.49779 Transcript_17521/m.49779 type:complete len:690 (-) Transcript_17521:100-2169(-)
MARTAPAIAAFATYVCLAAAVTPVEKVVELLENLSKKVEQEGKDEAAAYDKFACFCKAQADQKMYALEKSQGIIDEHEAVIGSLGPEITQLDQDIVALKGDVSTEKTAAEATTGTRQAAYDKYAVERKNLTEGIDAIARAMEHLRTARDNVDSVQTAAVLAQVQQLLVASGRRSRFLSQQNPKAYQYRSSEILAILMDLSKTFKSKLAELDDEEARDRNQHEMTEGASANKIAALEASIQKKETLSARKSEEKSERERLMDEEVSAKNADQSFLDELTTTCENKAKSWDERSKSRAAELTALTEAIGTLKGMGDLYNVNTKLTGFLATRGRRSAEVRQHAAVAPSLLQVAARRGARGGLARAMELLEKQAQALGSGSLASLILRLQAEPVDHFVKVRSIINDLIARLEQEALDEADAKSLCDTQMKDAVEKRDARQVEVEGFKAQIAATTAEIDGLEAKIKAIAKEIAELYKAVDELTTLRTQEKEQNEKAIADSKAGAEAISQALVVLKNYYESGGALLQRAKGAYVPPNADREGQTVSDLAPETFSGEYQGKVDSSKGIIGLLEVIATDFDRTDRQTTAAEQKAHEEFVEFDRTSRADIAGKETKKALDEEDHETTVNTIASKMDDLKSAQDLLDESLQRILKLKPLCIDTGMSYEERVDKRNAEMKALKKALCILDTDGVEPECEG